MDFFFANRKKLAKMLKIIVHVVEPCAVRVFVIDLAFRLVSSENWRQMVHGELIGQRVVKVEHDGSATRLEKRHFTSDT